MLPLPIRLESACSQAQQFDPSCRAPSESCGWCHPGSGGRQPVCSPVPAAFPGPRESNGDILSRQALTAAASPGQGNGPPGIPLPSPGRTRGRWRAQGGPHAPGGRVALELTCLLQGPGLRDAGPALRGETFFLSTDRQGAALLRAPKPVRGFSTCLNLPQLSQRFRIAQRQDFSTRVETTPRPELVRGGPEPSSGCLRGNRPVVWLLSPSCAGRGGCGRGAGPKREERRSPVPQRAAAVVTRASRSSARKMRSL